MARYIDADELYKATQKRIAEANEARMAVVDDEFLDLINDAFTEDVVPRAEVFEGVDKFRSDLMNKFIDLCRGNDYNKLTLLKIGDTVDQIYDKQIAELKKKYTEAEPPRLICPLQ